MITNSKGKKIIMQCEGLRLNAYKCPSGVWTIGYGHTKGVRENDQITQDQAIKYLDRDLAEAENAVNQAVLVDLNENQFSALVSFVYNVGAHNFRTSTLCKLLNQKRYQEASEQFIRWRYGTSSGVKVILDGLVKRRQLEKALFNDTDFTS